MASSRSRVGCRFSSAACEAPTRPASAIHNSGTKSRPPVLLTRRDPAMAIMGRLELPTCGLGNRRSIQLSYGTGRLYLAQANRPRFYRPPTLPRLGCLRNLVDEMIDRVEADQACHDEVDGDDEVQQSWNN